MDILADAEMQLRDATSKKILLEVTLLKAMEARNAVSIDIVLQQLQKLRQENGGEVVTIPIPTPSPGPKPFRAETTATVSAAVSLPPVSAPAEIHEQPKAPLETDLAGLWNALVEAVGRASPFARTYLLEAHPVSFNKNLFTIGFDPEFEDHIALVDNARNHALLQTKLAELGHASVQFKFIKAEAPAGWQRATQTQPEPAVAAAAPPQPAAPAARPATSPSAAPKEKPAPVPFNKDDFKNDPLIKRALEMFKGQIVEVRA
jgi:DNA polymerase-3 subunit gamma/tau